MDEQEIERSSSRPAGAVARGWSGSKIAIITKKLLAPIGCQSFFSLPPSGSPAFPFFSSSFIDSSLSRRMRTSGDAAASHRALRGAACIMEEASNDSAGKIADTRDGRDLQPDYLLSTYRSTWSSVSQFIIRQPNPLKRVRMSRSS